MDARQFLSLVIDWEQPGVFHGITTQAADKKGWHDYVVSNVDEAMEVVTDAVNRNLHVYFPTHSFNETQNTRMRGRKSVRLARIAKNASGTKLFYLDIDVYYPDEAQTGKKYPSIPDAVRALSEFIQNKTLPSPTLIVATGGGIQVYWVLDQTITENDWSPVAEVLKRIALEGMSADPTATSDAARVFRVPETFNVKPEYGTPRRAKVLTRPGWTPQTVGWPQMRDAVMRWSNVIPIGPQARAPLPAQAPAVPTGEFSANLPTRPQPTAEEVAAGCPWFDNTLKTGGAGQREPEWQLAVLASTFIQEGAELVHELSDQHPSYSERETDAKYASKEQARAQSPSLGFPTCKQIADAAGPAARCHGCPHLGAGRSPLAFVQTAPVTMAATAPLPPAQQEPLLPSGYWLTEDGVYTKHDNGKKVVEVRVCKYRVYRPRLEKDAFGVDMLVFDYAVGAGETILEGEVTVLSTQTSPSQIASTLSKHGFHVDNQEASHMNKFVMAWLREMQNYSLGDQKAPYGWTRITGDTYGFGFNRRFYTPLGEQPGATADSGLASTWGVDGDSVPWREAFDELILKRGDPGLAAIVAASFGAPLVRLTGQHGLILSAWSNQSGVGKSTAMRIGAAIWGNHKHALQNTTDTPLSMARRIGYGRSLPMLWDEVTAMDKDARAALRNFVLTLTQGRERTRLRSDASFQIAYEWSTMVGMCGNFSIAQMFDSIDQQTNALRMRLFEFRLWPSRTDTSVVDADYLILRLSENYGHAGAVFVDYLVRNQRAVGEQLRHITRQIEIKMNAKPEHRFWCQTVGVLLTAAAVAKKLHIADFDLSALRDFLIRELANMSGAHLASIQQRPNTAFDAIVEYLSDRRVNFTIEVNVAPNHQGQPATNILTDINKLRAVEVCVMRHTGTIHMRADALDRHMMNTRMMQRSVVEGAIVSLGGVVTYERFCENTPYDSLAELRVYRLPIGSLTGTLAAAN